MKIDFANLTRGYAEHKNAIDSAIKEVLDNAAFIMGPKVNVLEAELQNYVNVKHAISCASGTDALLLVLMALGIGAGDEVITTPFSFISTAEVIALVGATPVFVDIEEAGYNIDVMQIEQAITPKTKAIMPVSLYGQMPDLAAINTIAEKHGITVIEDAAQSFGAEQNGQKSCSMTKVSCTSFFPAKPLGCFGDGGAIFTNDDALAEQLKALRVHGQSERYVHHSIGITGRLDALQAAVLSVKLRYYDNDIDRRQQLALFYNENITLDCVKPKLAKGNSSVWAQYTLMVNNRADFQAYLQNNGIPTAVHYPIPLHLQKCFAYLNVSKGSLPIAESIAQQVVSLPMNPYFSEDEKQYIVKIVNSYNN